MYFKPVMPGTTYLSNYAIDDGCLTSIHQVLCDTTRTTYHVARVQEPNLKERVTYLRYHHRKVFFSLSLSFCTRNRTGQPIYLFEYNNNCNNTLHAPIRSHADNVARIKRKKKGGAVVWVICVRYL